MKIDNRLPLPDQIEETKAEAEDRLEAKLVPIMESFFAAVSSGVQTARERLNQFRRA